VKFLIVRLDCEARACTFLIGRASSFSEAGSRVSVSSLASSLRDFALELLELVRGHL